MKGCLWAMLLTSICYYIPKAVSEAVYFKDRREFKRTLIYWIIAESSITIALFLSAAFEHFA